MDIHMDVKKIVIHLKQELLMMNKIIKKKIKSNRKFLPQYFII